MEKVKAEIRKHSAKGGKFVFIHGKWWFVPGTYEIAKRKHRLGTRIIHVPSCFKLKKSIKRAKDGLESG